MKLNFVLVHNKDSKYFATTAQVDTGYNLLGAFDAYEKDKLLGYLEVIHFAKSKKQAEELARFWNNCYKENGTLNISYCGGSL